MEASLTQTPIDPTEDILLHTIDGGVRLWLSNEQINFKIPVGTITEDEIKRLQSSREKISTLLRRASQFRLTDVRGASHSRVDYAPLAFSQLVQWKLHQLRDRKSARVVASAVRLCGALDIDVLRASVQAMIDRHEALRTHIGAIGASPVQIVFKSLNSEMNLDDLTAVPRPTREAQLEQIFWTHVLEPIDIAKDSLFSSRLVRLTNDEHVLIVAMDHMVSDGMSMAIFLRDLFEEYESQTGGRRCSLPEISVQFADYAVWQRRAYRGWAEKHDQRWSHHLSGCRALTLVSEAVQGSSTPVGLGYVSIQIDSHLRGELVQWCRTRKTTLAMTVLTAFVSLVFRWYRTSQGIIQYQTSGRSMAEIQDTVGYFAFRQYLRVCLCERDTFLDLMDGIRTEYVAASEHGEFSSMDAYYARPELTRSPCFNWLAHDPIRSDLNCDAKNGRIGCHRVPYEDQITRLDDFRTDTELMVGFREVGNVIHGALQFPRSIITMDTAERFARNVIVFVRTLLAEPRGRVMQIGLVP